MNDRVLDWMAAVAVFVAICVVVIALGALAIELGWWLVVAVPVAVGSVWFIHRVLFDKIGSR